MTDAIDLHKAQGFVNSVVNNIQTVIVGKETQIRQALSCWLGRGHLLLEDVPGTGKTMLARTLATSVNVAVNRVQFTPDLLPGDIIGSSIYRQDQGRFEFIPGPLFTTVLLGDEINRATPRTQSALLEAMSERQITAEGKTMVLDDLFFTVATQNPIEQLGTFPLPEAQLDRFMMKLSLGYPQPQEEIEMLREQNQVHPIQNLKPVMEPKDWRWLLEQVKKVRISNEVYEYIVKIVAKTRNRNELKAGASPRATIALKQAAQATALIEGCDYVDPSHVYRLIDPILGHRLVLTTEAKLSNITALKVLAEIKAETKVPVKAK